MHVDATWKPDEALERQQPRAPTPSDEDRTMAMLAWMPFISGLVMLYILLVAGERAHPFRNYHAVHALMFNIVAGVVVLVLSIGIVGLCVLPVVLGYQVYMAYQAYRGPWREVSVLTNFALGQQ